MASEDETGNRIFVDRRNLLVGGALAAASATVSAQARQKVTGGRPASARGYRRIACEEAFAFAPVSAAQIAADPKLRMPERMEAALRDLGQGRIAEMDAAGVDMQVLSLSTPGVQVLEASLAGNLARETNDMLAETVSRFPERFAGLATIAPQDPVEGARELERAINRLRLKGALINSHTNDRYLDDPFFWPILEAAEALDVPIYIHPRDPSAGMKPAVSIPVFISWAFAVEVGTHALRLIAAGVFDRFPRLRIVLGHMGEGLPFLIQRINDRYVDGLQRGIYKTGFKRTPIEYLRENFVITTSGMNYDFPLRTTVAALGLDNILFAADAPFEDQLKSVLQMEAITHTLREKRKIFETNAVRTFKL